jgi:hypothetical protein
MSAALVPRVSLIDTPAGPGRTTATLVASLAARLASLHVISGADAVSSLVAGYAALGREVAKSEQGARLREAIQKGRAGANGDALWSALKIGEWASTAVPSPVLDQFRNDIALLLVDDLEQILESLPIPSQPTPAGAAEPEPVTFVDYVLGMWAFSGELVRAVEALATPLMPSPGGVSEAGVSTSLGQALLR